MEQFRCDQVHLGCDAHFSGSSSEAVLRQMTVHSWQSHSLHLPHLPATVVRQVLEALTTTAAGPADPGESSTTLPTEPSLVDVTGDDSGGDRDHTRTDREAPTRLSVGPRSAGSWSLGAAH